MTFTKTSQKFGQWADSRANTVYGLGFASEQHLTQVGLQDYMVGGTGLGLGLLPGTLGPWSGAAEWASELDNLPGSLVHVSALLATYSNSGYTLPFSGCLAPAGSSLTHPSTTFIIASLHPLLSPDFNIVSSHCFPRWVVLSDS